MSEVMKPPLDTWVDVAWDWQGSGEHSRTIKAHLKVIAHVHGGWLGAPTDDQPTTVVFVPEGRGFY